MGGLGSCCSDARLRPTRTFPCQPSLPGLSRFAPEPLSHFFLRIAMHRGGDGRDFLDEGYKGLLTRWAAAFGCVPAVCDIARASHNVASICRRRVRPCPAGTAPHRTPCARNPQRARTFAQACEGTAAGANKATAGIFGWGPMCAAALASFTFACMCLPVSTARRNSQLTNRRLVHLLYLDLPRPPRALSDLDPPTCPPRVTVPSPCPVPCREDALHLVSYEGVVAAGLDPFRVLWEQVMGLPPVDSNTAFPLASNPRVPSRVVAATTFLIHFVRMRSDQPTSLDFKCATPFAQQQLLPVLPINCKPFAGWVMGLNAREREAAAGTAKGAHRWGTARVGEWVYGKMARRLLPVDGVMPVCVMSCASWRGTGMICVLQPVCS